MCENHSDCRVGQFENRKNWIFTIAQVDPIDAHKFIYCAQFGENVQKLSKSGRFQKSAIFEGFWTFSYYRTK